MTDDIKALRGLMEKSADADFLREMIGFGAQRLMKLEVGALTGAAHGEKSPERLVQRNGYRGRNGRASDSEAAQGILLSCFLEPRRLAEKALTAVLQESLHSRNLDPLGGRPDQGHGHERNLEEPGEPALRGYR